MSFSNPLLQPAQPLPCKLGIIGAGTIGPDIGYYLKSAVPALKLVLVDISEKALRTAEQRLEGYVAKALARGRMNEADAAAVRSGIVYSTDYRALEGADWVIEAATEDLALKRRIFAQVEAVVADTALITSNTSSLPAQRLFAELRHPERATVTHFFAPAWRNPVVEVIRWAGASTRTVEYLRWVFAVTGKVPLLTEDVPCFMLDRIFDNWCNEAAHCLAWANAAEVDSVAGEFAAAGPFFVLNMAHGNPIIVETNTLQADEEGEHYRPAAIFHSVSQWQTAAMGERLPVAASTAAQVRDRLAGILLSQSVDIIDRGIGTAADLELGCRLALGFKRGPLQLIAKLGATEAGRMLERLAQERPGMPMAGQPLASYLRDYRHILLDQVDGVRIITLRRPEALNALHDELTDEILAAIRECEDDASIHGFVLTGYGTRAFCAGADIDRFVPLLGDVTASAQYARDCSRLLVHLDQMKKPVVAALNGMALGGGFELAMRCHAIVAIRTAVLQLPEVTLGIAPGIGALVIPYRRWPAAAATFNAMLRQAARINAEQAHALGVVTALANDAATAVALAVSEVRALAGKARASLDGAVAAPVLEVIEPRARSGQVLSAQVLGIVDQAILQAAAAPTLAAALELGYQAFAQTACTAAAREGIQAFVERRPADFSQTG